MSGGWKTQVCSMTSYHSFGVVFSIFHREKHTHQRNLFSVQALASVLFAQIMEFSIEFSLLLLCGRNSGCWSELGWELDDFFKIAWPFSFPRRVKQMPELKKGEKKLPDLSAPQGERMPTNLLIYPSYIYIKCALFILTLICIFEIFWLSLLIILFYLWIILSTYVIVQVPNVKWEDIGGLEDVKNSILETVQVSSSQIYSGVVVQQVLQSLLFIV